MVVLSMIVLLFDGGVIIYIVVVGGGDICQIGVGVLLLVKNDDSSDYIVMLVMLGIVNGFVIEDCEVIVEVGIEVVILVMQDYWNLLIGCVQINYDDVILVIVVVVRVVF